MQNKINSDGFTLLEALLVLILVIGATGILLKVANLFSTDFFTLKKETERVKKILETVREQAVLADKGENWGVIFFNTTTQDYFYTFAGNNFSSATSSEIKFLNKSLDFANIPIGSSSEIVFQKYNGETATNSSITIKALGINKSFQINISQPGSVNYSSQ
jgi:type II secretory pathway pseudopilin PulG